MKRMLILALLILGGWSAAWSQTVLVNGVDGEDTDSSPRDSDNRIIGPETDDTFETFSAALKFLTENRGRGTITLSLPSGASIGGNVTIPLTLIPAGTSQTVSAGIQVFNTSLDTTGIEFTGGGSAFFLNNSTFTARRTSFNGVGISVQGEGESTITVSDSIFINSQPNGLTGFGGSMNVDFQNVEFEDFKGANKCLAIQPTTGRASVLVKDCTFTNGYLGIDDRRTQGDALYQNIVMDKMGRIGLNVEWDGGAGPLGEVSTIIRDSRFDNCSYQGIHLHAHKNVNLINVKASGCGSVSFRDQDGAGIGGHDGNININLEDCESSNNKGDGFNFETQEDNITLNNCIANDNDSFGMKFMDVETLTVQMGCWISGNKGHGLKLIRTKDFKIHNCTIGLDRNRREAKGNYLGISLSDPGDGEIGSIENPLNGNVISGNQLDGIFMSLQNNTQYPTIKIGSNNIGTDGEGAASIPNEYGIYIIGNAGGFIQIGGDNPSLTGSAGDMGVGNIISGNRSSGIFISSDAEQPLKSGRIDIWGNYIGVASNGRTALPNNLDGIDIANDIFASINIGDPTAIAKGNLISGNKLNGLYLNNPIPDSPAKIKNINIDSNLIGVAIDRTSELKNEKSGVSIKSITSEASGSNQEPTISDIKIRNNTIQRNGEYGVVLDGENVSKVTISHNIIHRNMKHGIRLLNGANGGVKAWLDHAYRPKFLGELYGKVPPNSKVEIFTDPLFEANEPGYWGQGKTFSNEFTANEIGEFVLNVTPIASPGFITITATDPSGNTSEFSPFASVGVTQVVGDDGKRLTANKTTVLRVYTDSGKGGAARQIKGNATLAGDAQIAKPEAFQMKAYGGYDADPRVRRTAANSLNFYFKKPPQGEQSFEVTLKEGDIERGSFRYGPYTFQQLKNITMAVVPVLAPPRAGGPPTVFPDFNLIQQTLKYFADVYPIDAERFLSYVRWTYPLVLSSPPHDGTRVDKVMCQIAETMRLQILPPPDYAATVIGFDTYFNPPGSRGFLYGFTYPDIPKVIALIDADKRRAPPRDSGDTLAHEVGHTVPFDLGDTYADGTVTGRNPIIASRSNRSGMFVMEEDAAFSPTGLLGNQGPKDPSAAFSILSRNDFVYDFMGSRAPAWAEPTGFSVIFRELGGVVAGAAKTTRPYQEDLDQAIIVRGTTTLNGPASLERLLFQEGPVARMEPSSASQAYRLDLKDAGGGLLDTYSFLIARTVERLSEDESGNSNSGYFTLNDGFFTTHLRNEPGAETITLSQNGTVLAEMTRPPNTPVVTSISGLENGVPADPFDLTWTATDADPGDANSLYYDVLYSSDGGEGWMPLAIDLREPQLTIYPAFLPGSKDGMESLIQVRVSDGWNQSSLNAAPFQRFNQPPSVNITAADNRIRFSDAIPITLTGAALDPEDGILTGESLQWRWVEQDKPLGNGVELFADLPIGTHTIELTATDSQGLQTTQQVTVEVYEEDGTSIPMWRLLE
ncbi:MAG: hypothetical protein GC154_15505 [bacterium]|nr:hypothetical protein [bacterium]